MSAEYKPRHEQPEKTRVFTGTLEDYINRVSFGNTSFKEAVIRVAGEAVTEPGYSIGENFTRFSNKVGVKLLDEGQAYPAVECLELATVQEFWDQKDRRPNLSFARNYLEALRRVADDLMNIQEESRITWLKWIRSKQVIIGYINSEANVFNDTIIKDKIINYQSSVLKVVDDTFSLCPKES